MLGHVSTGRGAARVIVLHDWMGDHRNYEPMLPYLSERALSYVFADLRGYGLSRDLLGRYTLDEAAGDVLALAQHLGWSRYHLVGHSMSSLVAQQVASVAGDSVDKLVLLTPLGPAGIVVPEPIIEYLEQLAVDEPLRRAGIGNQWGDRLSSAWLEFKLERWKQSARVDAVRAYVRMFSGGSVSEGLPGHIEPLVVTGEHDSEPFTESSVRAAMASAYRNYQHVVCRNAGHYPMQETPVALATAIERYLLDE